MMHGQQNVKYWHVCCHAMSGEVRAEAAETVDRLSTRVKRGAL